MHFYIYTVEQQQASVLRLEEKLHSAEGLISALSKQQQGAYINLYKYMSS
jgi:hypothetical protein